MKKLLPLLMLAHTTFYSYSQKMACCSMSASHEFAALSNDEAFVNMHPYPKSNVSPKEGEMIKIPVAGGEKANAFVIKTKEESSNYLFVFHEWWGLNDNIKQEAKKYYDKLDNVNVIALDLYDGLVATDREKAAQLMQQAKDERIQNIINGAIQYVGEDASVGTVGWCFGGGWSLQAAIMLGDQASGCVMFYGMPEKDMGRLKKLKTDVLGIFALQDKWITPEVVNTFEENMEKSEQSLKVMNFDADHAFANPSNPGYNKKAAEKAFKEAIAFLEAQ